MKICILGGGSIGTRHLTNLMALGVPLEDVTVYDLESAPRCSSEIPGVRVLDAMAHRATEVDHYDASLICFPAAMHANKIGFAIRARRPFLVEKPATLHVGDLSDADWLTDVPHLVGYNWRFHPELRRARRLAPIADAIAFECRTDLRHWPGTSYGPRLAECSHEIDLALAWCGPADLVVYEDGDAESVLRLEHASGQTTSIAFKWNWVQAQWGRRIELTAPFLTNDGHAVTVDIAAVGAGLDQSYLLELRHFLDVARGEATSLNTLAQARSVVRICEQASAVAA